ncbi:hypothetical protein F8M41_000910 [Gigaspora margarita]|uniref:Uncharacterized protein n=1 Tax=Gigaspora margarita TaxID=4874 RepID=A0A8H3XH56_GIGMA|nr:hypothetical protein F8M41_000910 [Gigaspora margarita]
MKPINTILLMFTIVFLFVVSESISTPKDGSFPAAKTQSGYKNLLIEQVSSCPPDKPNICGKTCCTQDQTCCQNGCCPHIGVCCPNKKGCCPVGYTCCGNSGCCGKN